jgi:hypothetical protein
MACSPPPTGSPGRLVLHYAAQSGQVRHTIGWHFITGVDLTDIVHLQAEADRLAGLLAACCTAAVTFVDWSIQLPNGSTFYAAPLPSAHVGTHATATGMQNWASMTVAFEGTGNPSAPGICTGKSVSRVHCYGAVNFRPFDKFFTAAADAAYAAFITSGLNASTYLPADAYGQQADILLLCPIQWNAHTQRTVGS